MARFHSRPLPDLIESWTFRVDLPLNMYYLGKGQGDQICVSVGVIGLIYFFWGGVIGLNIQILCPIPSRLGFSHRLPIGHVLSFEGARWIRFGSWWGHRVNFFDGKGVYRVKNSNYVILCSILSRLDRNLGFSHRPLIGYILSFGGPGGSELGLEGS